jgi:hypothetical protein
MTLSKLKLIFVSFPADSQGEDGSTDGSHYSQDESSEMDCLIEQTLPEEEAAFEVLIMKPKYGFGNQYSDVFKGYAVSYTQIVLNLNTVYDSKQFVI